VKLTSGTFLYYIRYKSFSLSRVTWKLLLIPVMRADCPREKSIMKTPYPFTKPFRQVKTIAAKLKIIIKEVWYKSLISTI